VLGQGTFGQVVKCQNLKTQEVVAVKVIKNRTAYFNQSMMEVSVLDLVSHSMSYATQLRHSRLQHDADANTISSTPSWIRTTTTTSCGSRTLSSTGNISALCSSF
jgi:serine/threonine protein kinase